MYSAIILAGGLGSRIKNDVPKQFILLAGKPIIMHTLERLEKIDSISEVIVVCHNDYIQLMKEYIDEYMFRKEYKLVSGGSTRQESVYNGLKEAVSEHVIIHESARPFVQVSDFNRLIGTNNENATFGISIPFTVLQGKQEISGLLERDELVNIQLPQKFNRELLFNAHIKAKEEGRIFTEDAGLLYYYGKTGIAIIKGSPNNIKITNPIDIVVGESIYKEYIIGRN